MYDQFTINAHDDVISYDLYIIILTPTTTSDGSETATLTPVF